jgi:hypothetical protein
MYLLDTVRSRKQKLDIQNGIPMAVNFEHLTPGHIIDVERMGKSGSSLWVVWAPGKNPPRSDMYVQSDGHQYSLTVAKNVLSFPAPPSYPHKPIYLIDPATMKYQNIITE